MTIKELVKEYERTNELPLNSLNIKNHVPYIERLNKGEHIAKCTTLEIDENGNFTDVIKVNTLSRCILFALTLLDMYTDLEVNYDDIIYEYDFITMHGICEKIISRLNAMEVEQFDQIIQCISNDYITNTYSAQAWITSTLSKMGKTYMDVLGDVTSTK